MNKKVHTQALLISAALTLSACFSDQPTSYYLLKPQETDPVLTAATDFENMTVLLRPVKIPEYLERPQMAVRETDVRLFFSEYHRWAEPLADNFTQVFLQNLNTRIRPGVALRFIELQGIEPDVQLMIEVLRLDVSEQGQAVLNVKWELLTVAMDEKPSRHENTYTVPIKERNFEAAVEAQSQTIALFADQVAKTLHTVKSPTKPAGR